MNIRNALGGLAMAAAMLAAASGCAGVPREPQVLPTVSEVFPAAYDAVWDATLRGLGVVKVLAADKAAGRIETEPFPFAYIVGHLPAPPRTPIHLAALGSGGVMFAQSGSGGGDTRATQVIWVAMRIAVARMAEDRTSVQVEPRIHDSLLVAFTPGPTNNPWSDLFARIRQNLGTR